MALTLWEELPEGVVEQRCWGTLVLTELNQPPQSAARAGVLKHIPAPPEHLRKHLRWVVFGHWAPQDCLQPLLAFRAGPG